MNYNYSFKVVIFILNKLFSNQYWLSDRKEKGKFIQLLYIFILYILIFEYKNIYKYYKIFLHVIPFYHHPVLIM